MMVRDIPSDSQNPTFLRKRIGNRMKNSSDGITNQKIPCDKSAIFAASFVSMYIQTNANKETIGTEAKILPVNVLLFEISEIATIVTDDSNTLIR